MKLPVRRPKAEVPPVIYILGDCALDTQRHTLHCAGRPIRLRLKAFQILTYLLAHRDRLISKQELAEQVWPDHFVSDAALEGTIKTVRQAIGDSGRAQQLIRTVHGAGYRFIAAVAESPDIPAGLQDESPRDQPDARSVLPRDAPNVAPSPPAQDAVGGDEGFGRLSGGEQDTAPRRSDSPTPGEWRLVTVLCCAPVTSSSVGAQQDAETQYHQLSRLYALTEPAVQRYGGALQPIVGDQILAIFGAPVAQEDHAQRAVLTALELQRRVQEDNFKCKIQPGDVPCIRMGLHTGRMVAGGLGEVLGDAVTRAMALQAQAAPGTILCSEATACLVQGVVRLEKVGLVPVAVKPIPVTAYTVLGHRSPRRPLAYGERRVWTPFIGRRRELKTLHMLLAQVEVGQGQVVGVMGEPGIGKSRLVYEFQQCLRERPVTYLSASCVSHGATTPYLPLLVLLRQNCGLTEGNSQTAIAAKVRMSLEEVGLEPEHWAPYLLELLEVPAEMDRLATVSMKAVKARTVEAFVQLALHTARRRPLVLEVENLHWMDPTSEEVVAALVERLVGARILLLLTYRPGYLPPWIGKSYSSQLALAPLAPRDSRRLVQAITRTTPVSEAVMQAILAHAEGNPFFLEELARGVIEQGASHRMILPQTLQTVLAARIDRLPPQSKRLLQRAAVIGKDIPVPLLEAVAGISKAELEGDLTHLRATELLFETMRCATRTVSFKHALIRETAYQSLLRSTRQEYHHRTAQVLEEHFPETADTQPELLAHHYTEAGLSVQAIPYWQRAGQRAVERSAHLEALQHLTTGLALLATLPDTPMRAQQELDLQLALGPTLMATKGFAAPEVEQTYARARALCAQVGDTPQLLPTLRGLWRFYYTRGALPTARELADQLSRLAQRTAAPTHLLEAHSALGATLFHLGDYATARTHLDQGIALIDPPAQRALALRHGEAAGVWCLAAAALALWSMGYPTQAVRRSQEALALAREFAHPQSLAEALHMAAYLHYCRREVPVVQELAATLLTLATAQGFPLYAGFGRCWRGWALAMQGQALAGLAQLRQGLAAILATGNALAPPRFLVLFAEAAGYTGQIAEGLRRLTEALTGFQASGRGDALAEAYRLEGALRLQQGAPAEAEAEASFCQALAIARRQQAKSWELRAALSLSRLWGRQGRHREAYDLLREIYSWFTEGFDTPDLQEARALLKSFAPTRRPWASSWMLPSPLWLSLASVFGELGSVCEALIQWTKKARVGNSSLAESLWTSLMA